MSRPIPARASVFAIALSLAAACKSQPEAAVAEPTAAEPTAVAEPTAAEPTAAEPTAAPGANEAAAATASDRLATDAGDVEITPLRHGTLRLSFAGRQVYVDPWSQAPLPDSPKADLVLVTDIHGDHFDAAAIERVKGPSALVVGPKVVTDELPGAITLANGETKQIAGLSIQAVAMYNLRRGPSEGKLFHDPGRGNGYLIGFGGKRIYLSGDTECTPEMKALDNVDLAFVCMNLPYTMPPEEAAECVQAFRPKVVYPYHYRGSDLGVFQRALADEAGIEVRLRDWYGPEG